MEDLNAALDAQYGLTPGTLDSDGTVVGSSVDCIGRRAVLFVVSAQVVADGVHELQVWESDVPGFATENLIPDERVMALDPLPVGAPSIGRVLAVPERRYVRLKIVSSGVTAGAINVAATGLLTARNAA